MIDNVYSLVKIIEKDAAVQFEIKLFDFSTSLNSLLIIFIWPYTVNYRNALDRLRVRMNIILLWFQCCGYCVYLLLLFRISVPYLTVCQWQTWWLAGSLFSIITFLFALANYYECRYFSHDYFHLPVLGLCALQLEHWSDVHLFGLAINLLYC